jgi:DNA-binding CsgD family transcriptional regulator
MVDAPTEQGHAAASSALSPQERDILTRSAQGAHVSEVSSALGLTQADVRRALESARTKLGARSKLEAVIIAVRRGHIQP